MLLDIKPKPNFVDFTELAYYLFVYIFEIFHGSILFSRFFTHLSGNGLFSNLGESSKEALGCNGWYLEGKFSHLIFCSPFEACC